MYLPPICPSSFIKINLPRSVSHPNFIKTWNPIRCKTVCDSFGHSFLCFQYILWQLCLSLYVVRMIVRNVRIYYHTVLTPQECLVHYRTTVLHDVGQNVTRTQTNIKRLKELGRTLSKVGSTVIPFYPWLWKGSLLLSINDKCFFIGFLTCRVLSQRRVYGFEENGYKLWKTHRKTLEIGRTNKIQVKRKIESVWKCDNFSILFHIVF